MSQTIFNLLKIPILSHKPLHTGDTTEAQKISAEHCFLCVFVWAFHASKTKIACMMSHSFDLFQFYTWKILYPRYFSLVACIPRKVVRHMTSDIDVCEVDLGMQMNFLNAAPLERSLFLRSNHGRCITSDKYSFLQRFLSSVSDEHRVAS